MDYLPKGCLVCVSESGRTAEALKGWLGQLKADVTAAMDSGILCGPMAEAALPEIRQVLGQWESWVTQDLTQAERRSLELLLGKLKARAAARIGQD